MRLTSLHTHHARVPCRAIVQCGIIRMRYGDANRDKDAIHASNKWLLSHALEQRTELRWRASSIHPPRFHHVRFYSGVQAAVFRAPQIRGLERLDSTPDRRDRAQSKDHGLLEDRYIHKFVGLQLEQPPAGKCRRPGINRQILSRRRTSPCPNADPAQRSRKRLWLKEGLKGHVVSAMIMRRPIREHKASIQSFRHDGVSDQRKDLVA